MMGESTRAGGAEEQKSDLFRLLVASVKDYSIFLLDPQGYIQSWNEGAERTKGYSAEEIIGRHFSIFYAPKEVRNGKPEYALRVAADEGRWEEEGWRFRNDGSRFWADVVITALRDDQGDLVGFAKVTRDLSERKRAEDERRQLLELERLTRLEAEAALERLQALQQVTETALTYVSLDELLVALLDRIGEILIVDSAAVLLLDEDEPDMLITHAVFGSAFEGKQGTRLRLDQSFAGQGAAERRPTVIEELSPATVPDQLVHDSSLRSVLGVPLLAKGRMLGLLYAGVVRQRRFSPGDVQYLSIIADRIAMAIEHLRLNETARIARVEADVAEATVRTQNEFMSIAAHELKTPLTGILTAAQLLLRRSQRQAVLDPAQLQRGLQTIERQADRMSRLIGHLLETTRLQVGQLRLERAWANLAMLVQEIVEEAEAGAEYVRITLSAPQEAWATIDPLRIEQVVTNLIDNAIKFSPPGERIDVALDCPDDENVRLVVRDRGTGVPPEHRPHLFERFYQAHAATHQSGLGLGLFISREIVMLHGGTITAEFPPDGGTCLVVILPRSAPSELPAPHHQSAAGSR